VLTHQRGSVKPNIGHLEGGSGLAGIAKAIMVLEKGVIPPNALFEKINPKIDTALLKTAVSPFHY
jgi:acyl transferase domain-containing protein